MLQLGVPPTMSVRVNQVTPHTGCNDSASPSIHIHSSVYIRLPSSHTVRSHISRYWGCLTWPFEWRCGRLEALVSCVAPSQHIRVKPKRVPYQVAQSVSGGDSIKLELMKHLDFQISSRDLSTTWWEGGRYRLQEWVAFVTASVIERLNSPAQCREI